MQLNISAHDEYYTWKFLAIVDDCFTRRNLSKEHIANKFSDETLWTNAKKVVEFELEVWKKLRHQLPLHPRWQFLVEWKVFNHVVKIKLECRLLVTYYLLDKNLGQMLFAFNLKLD